MPEWHRYHDGEAGAGERGAAHAGDAGAPGVAGVVPCSRIVTLRSIGGVVPGNSGVPARVQPPAGALLSVMQGLP